MDSYEIFEKDGNHLGTVNMPCPPAIGTILYVRDLKNYAVTNKFKVVHFDFSITMFESRLEKRGDEIVVERPTARVEILVEKTQEGY